MNKRTTILMIIGLVGIIIIASAIQDNLAQAQLLRTVSAECEAQRVEAQYFYRVYGQEEKVIYVVGLKAGKCTTAFSGEMTGINNIDQRINQDIEQRLTNSSVQLRIEPTRILMVGNSSTITQTGISVGTGGAGQIG